jgi:hypothetical protein
MDGKDRENHPSAAKAVPLQNGEFFRSLLPCYKTGFRSL